MDDKEYYSLMNRSSSWALQQALKKKTMDSKKTPQMQNAVDGVNSYSNLEARQGRADAEMLLEKKNSQE